VVSLPGFEVVLHALQKRYVTLPVALRTKDDPAALVGIRRHRLALDLRAV
jgi:hypothetical protein